MTLTEQTRNDNKRFFGELDDVPRHVVTQGIGTMIADTPQISDLPER